MFTLTISENFLLFFSAFGVIQGVLSTFVLYFHPKGDKYVNFFLALYILLPAGSCYRPLMNSC